MKRGDGNVFFILSFFLSLFFWGDLNTARAARPAEVQSEDLPVYETLRPGSAVIRTLPQGSKIVVSNVPTAGFYKIRTQEGELGWVDEKGLQLLERPTEEQLREAAEKKSRKKAEREARMRAEAEADAQEMETRQKRTVVGVNAEGREVEETVSVRQSLRRWTFGAFVGASTASLDTLKTLTGLEVPTTGYHFGVEFQYKGSKDALPILLRVEDIHIGSVVKDRASGQIYDMEASSTPIFAGVKWGVVENNYFKIDLDLLIGGSVSQKFVSKALSQEDPAEIEMNASTLGGIVKVDFIFELSEQWSLGIDIGYRLLKSSRSTYSKGSTSTNGSSLFTRAGVLTPTEIDMSGMFAGLGMYGKF